MEEGHPDHFPSAKPIAQEEASDWEAFEEGLSPFASGPSIDQFPTSPLPAIDQWPTQPMEALVDGPFAFPYRSMWGNEAIEEIDLLLTPGTEEAERKAETGPHAAARQSTGAFRLGRTLAKSSGIYALASFAYPLVSLVLAPFLTHHLSPNDYGILTVLNTMIGLMTGVTQLGLGPAFFRSYTYEYANTHEYTEQQHRRTVLATLIVLICLISLFAAVVVSLLAAPLAWVLFHRSSLGGLIILTIGAVVMNNLSVPGTVWLGAEHRSSLLALLWIVNPLIVLGMNLFLLGLLHWGVEGSLLATGGGYAFAALCTLPVLLWRSKLQVRVDIAWRMLTFGMPQVLSNVSFWVLQLSDRYLLALLATLAQAATYGVGYSLGLVVSTLVIAPFNVAWPSTMYTIAKREDAAQVFKTIFRWFSIVLLFVGFVVSVAGSFMLDWLFPVSYRSAAPVIAIVAESIIFYGLYIFFMTGANIRRKTWMPAVFMVIAAVVNVGSNLVLIPHYGLIGAATSTLIAYLLLTLIAYVANQRIYPIPYEIGRFLFALLVGVALYVGAGVLSLRWESLWHWSLSFFCVALYGAYLFVQGGGIGLLRAHRAKLLAYIVAKRSFSS